MKILALDASLSSTGYAIYDTDLKDFTRVDCIKTTKKKATPTSGKRINQINIEISHILFWEAIDVVLIEDIFVGGANRLSSAIPLAILRGSIQETVYGLGYDDLYVAETKKIKKAVTGNGAASKELVYETLRTKYHNSPVVVDALGDELIQKGKDKNEDKSDAIALIDAYICDPSVVHPA